MVKKENIKHDGCRAGTERKSHLSLEKFELVNVSWPKKPHGSTGFHNKSVCSSRVNYLDIYPIYVMKFGTDV